MTFHQFLHILWVRKGIIVLVTLLLIGTAIGVGMLLPQQYKATTTVVVDLKTPDPVMGVVVPNMAIASYMATQVDMIGSLRVARKVVENLGLDKGQAIREDWRKDTDGRGDLRDWLAELLLKRLDVKPSKESNVIEVIFSGVDPTFAATTANAFAQAYIDTVVELRADPAQQNAAFFDARVKGARDAMEAAQKKLNDYQRENNIVSVDERLDVENQRLADLSNQYTLVQSQAVDSRSREGAASRRNSETLQETQQSMLVQGLKVELARAEGKLQETGARLGIAHPQYRSSQAEVASLRAKLDVEMAKVRDTIGTTNAVNTQRENQLRAAMEAQRNRVLQLKAQRDQVSALQAEVLQAQKQFDILSQRYTQTSLESENRQTNVAILSPAPEPIKVSFPKHWLNGALAFVLGVLLGSIVALLLELRDRRIRSADDLAHALIAPLLVVMPNAAQRRVSRAPVPRLASPAIGVHQA